MAPSGAAKKPYWGCKCGFDSNWACKPKCHQCGNGAPYKVLARIAETKASGVANAAPKAKAKARAKANSNTSSGGAKGQQQQLDAAKHKHAQELKKLKEELEGLRKANASQVAEAEPNGSGMDLGSESELDKAVTRAREKLKKAKDLPEEVRDLVAGGYEQCLARLQSVLTEAQAARRAANPLGKQLEGGSPQGKDGQETGRGQDGPTNQGTRT